MCRAQDSFTLLCGVLLSAQTTDGQVRAASSSCSVHHGTFCFVGRCLVSLFLALFCVAYFCKWRMLLAADRMNRETSVVAAVVVLDRCCCCHHCCCFQIVGYALVTSFVTKAVGRALRREKCNGYCYNSYLVLSSLWQWVAIIYPVHLPGRPWIHRTGWQSVDYIIATTAPSFPHPAHAGTTVRCAKGERGDQGAFRGGAGPTVLGQDGPRRCAADHQAGADDRATPCSFRSRWSTSISSFVSVSRTPLNGFSSRFVATARTDLRVRTHACTVFFLHV